MDSHDLSQACPGQDVNDGLYNRLADFKNRMNMNFETFSSLLRLMGASVLVCALSMFLFKDWQHGDDISRSIVLIGFSVILSLTGIVCGRWIQEAKGARLFLALGLLSVPINFTVLGALVYSKWPLDVLPQHYPAHWLWQAADPQLLMGLTLIGWVVMAAVSWLGVRVLAPRSVKPLTAVLLLNSSLLLVPGRSTIFVISMGLVMAGVILFTLRRLQTSDRSLATRESIYVRILQFLPLGILLGRAFVLYGFDSWMYGFLWMTGYVVLRQLGHYLGTTSVWRKNLETVSVFPALIATAFSGDILSNLGTPNALIVPILVMLFSAMMIELSLHCASSGRCFRWIATITLVVGSSFHLYVESALFSAVFCMLCGIMVIALGFLNKQAELFVPGIVGFMYGLVYQLILAYEFFNLGSWGTLGIIGVVSILAGSLLERYGLQWKTRYQQWQTPVKAANDGIGRGM